MSFEKHSNFNKLANFSEVKFGENKPVLEVELNEMQQIQNEARADIIRDTMPSGFVTLGEIDYDYCANNDNQIKLKTESIAYVNGYRITIPKDTIIEIGESDKEREDLVFLEVWKEAVNDIDTLTEYGGENNAVINNPIKDERYPVATSQRVALKYRIRHVADVDFETYPEGIGLEETTWNQIPWDSYPNPIAPQGGRDTLYDLQPSIHHRYMFGKAMNVVRGISFSAFRNFPHIDLGLYISGNGTDLSKMDLKTLDGYVYAIPMFRLIRKPNVGLASPFEYKKIHNQLDPKKFAHLVGQENVEKVHSVDIKGKTYKNLLGNGSITSTNNNNGYVKEFVEPLNPQGTYTLFAWGKLISGANKVNFNFMGYDGASHILNEMITPNETETNFMKRVVKLNYPTNCTVKWRDRVNVMSELVDVHYVVLEGDHTDTVLLEPFNYIKSLGELDNNSITVENNLVEEGTYVPELQNNILPTHPEVTYVTWGEDVVIPPEVEIELKNGEEVIQTITQLPVKLETTGEEKLHVKTMKGQTLVNMDAKNQILAYCQNDPFTQTQDDNYVTVTVPSVSVPHSSSVVRHETSYGFIEGKTYTIISDTSCVPIELIYNGGQILMPKSYRFAFVAPKNMAHIDIYYRKYADIGSSVTYKFPKKVVILEGDYTNVDIPYFEGMKSVEAPSIKVTGKNLFDEVWESGSFNGTTGVEITDNNTVRSKNYIKVEPNKPYTLDVNAVKVYYDINYKVITVDPTTSSSKRTITTPSNCHYVRIRMSYDDNNNKNLTKQFEEGYTSTSYETHKSNILRTPSDLELRRIGDVKDELNYLTGEVTERIGEIVLDGSEDWEYTIETFRSRIISDKVFEQLTPSDREKIYLTCDKYKSIKYSAPWDSGEFIALHISKQIVFRDERFANVKDWKQYLSQNPITVQYQLAKSTIKKIGLSEDDYVGKSKVTYQLAEPLRKVGTYSDFIKGNTLYSNIGVEVLDGSENITQRGETLENTLLFVTHLTDLGIKSNLIYSDKFDGTDISWNEVITSDKEFIRLYTNDTNALYIRISKSKLATQDVNGFKKWLQANPVTIYYVKANPMEIPLKEVSPLDVDFSLNRQFKRGYENYLKELPNGVKDTVDGKLITRRIAHLCINDTIPFAISESNDSYPSVLRIWIREQNIPKLKPNCSILCDTLPVKSKVNSPCIIATNGLDIHLPLSNNASVQDAQEYLRQNPINVFYELSTPTTEELTEENSRYVPYMPLNSYVGSLYVADGINQTKFLTDFSPSEYEVQTYHRYFSNEFNVFEDTTLKKSPYGHKTYLEEVDGKYVEKFIAGLEKHEIEDLRHKVSLTGFDYSQLLQDSFLKLIKGELS